jgi:exo-poly-alpha-galacturonosidase
MSNSLVFKKYRSIKYSVVIASAVSFAFSLPINAESCSDASVEGSSFSNQVDGGCENKNYSISMPAPEVPALALDDSSVVLVWRKPSDYANIVDYKVYRDGKFIGYSSESNNAHSPAYPYIRKFHDTDTDNYHGKTTFLSYKAVDLQPETSYSFSVTAIFDDGTESRQSESLTITTAPAFTNIVNVVDYGAVGDGSTVNTEKIQQAIDDCSKNSVSAYGCKVVIPGQGSQSNGSVFVTGALFLNSNMTLEIEENATLKGSTDAGDYPLEKGYQIYSFKTNPTDSRRPPSLLNVLSTDHRNGSVDEQVGYDNRRNVYKNIRVVGEGVIDGSGWKRSDQDTIDETGNKLAYFEKGDREKVYALGDLAYNQMLSAWKEYDSSWTGKEELQKLIENNYGGYKGQINKDLYSNRRSSLATFRGVNNFYFGGLTLLNPAYHGIMFLECANAVFAYTTTQSFDINNGDGVEFGNSENILVFNNFIDSGDDNINFAAGQGADYAQGKKHVRPTQDVWVFNNYMREGHGAVTLGSHTGAWIQDILAEENVMFLTDNGLRMKSTTATGGGGRRVLFRDNAMKDIGTKNTHDFNGVTVENRGSSGNPFVFTLKYAAGSNVFNDAETSAQFRDITVKNVTLDNVSADTGKNLIKVAGYGGTDDNSLYPETFHENIYFKKVNIRNSAVTDIDHLKDSVFEDVSITDWDPEHDTVWQIKDSKNVKFINVSPEHQDVD